MTFEYGSIVLAHAKPAESGEWPALMERLVKRLEQDLRQGDGGWELVSHAFLLLDEELVVTFITRHADPGV